MYCFCRSSKALSVRIIFLDETEFLHEIQKELSGQALLEIVFGQLNLLETAYFGLRFLDVEGQTRWLEANTRLSNQLKESKEIYELYFSVKFYAVDPCKLVEEITRYQFYLQLKQDVLQGRLPVTFDLASQLGAYVVQSELGDYDSNKHLNGYVSEFRLVPNQTKDLEYRIIEIHKQLKGVGHAQAEFNYLDKVKWLDMYGVDLHPVMGEDNVEYFLGLTPSGIIVLRNKSTVAHYYWPRIAKVYFKGRFFMLRVCDKNNEVSTFGFETPKKTACKHLWRCCVEHHAFFRLNHVTSMPQTSASEFFSLGSRFRYSGRTERQATKEASNIKRVPPIFTRRHSKRQLKMISDPNSECKNLKKKYITEFESKSISVPQPAYTIDSEYRSTCSIPATFNNTIQKYFILDSPRSTRSTRSAGWAKNQQRGLFGISSSPKSVRSASSRNGSLANGYRHRSSSIESQSSNDSRSGRRHRSRGKRISDNESELSRGSGRSGRSHRKRRRHRSRNRELIERQSFRDCSYTSEPETLVKALEVQQNQQIVLNMGSVQQASVVKSDIAPKSYDSTDTFIRNRKNKKHRSPDTRNKIWSSELTKHLQFDLVETSGMSEDQLKEIPYTVVETSVNRKRNNTSSLKVYKSAYGKDRIDIIRNLQVSMDKHIQDGSIRSGSTNSSSQDFERVTSLNGMISNLNMGEFTNKKSIKTSHEHTDSGLGEQDYAYSSERSSDSAKYTNKSTVLSGKMTSSSLRSKICSGNNHLDQGRINITMAPVHTKIAAKLDNHIIKSFINNNTQTCNKHYSLSLNREDHNKKYGVGCISTLVSPYAGNGVESVRGTQSDICVSLNRSESRIPDRNTHKNNTINISKFLSVHSDPSNNETTFQNFNNENMNNYYELFSKTGSKLLYTNKQRLNIPLAHNTAHKFGPLLYKKEIEDPSDSNWKQLTNGLSSGLCSTEQLNNKTDNSSRTNGRNNISKSSSLELILSPIIQSNRAKH